MSASVLSPAMIRFWRPRIFRTLRNSRSAGAPERIAALRFSELPTSAVPNSLMSSCRRRLNGSRRVFWTRSCCTVVWLRAASIGASSGSSACPGWQFRKYSAISDCGSDEQLASAFSSGNSGPTSKLMSAVFSGVMSRPVTVPALTPATRSSEPSTRPKALKSSAW